MVQSDCMNYGLFFTLILALCLILCTGCVTSKQSTAPVQTQIPADTTVVPSAASDSGQAEKATSSTAGTSSGPTEAKEADTSSSEQAPSARMDRADTMDAFIATSFPLVTEAYTGIKKSRNALEWKAVQDKALKLQILIQDLKKTYQLEVPNPEKTVFEGLDSRQQIVFLKYVRYLNDMESYATNLKNAVYYQEKGNDPQSAQTAKRYQDLADQFEKQVIAEVKTIVDYANDFKYTFMNPTLADQYRYVG